MKILALNSRVDHPDVVYHEKWDDTISMLDFDAVIFGLEYLTIGFQTAVTGYYKGLKCLSDAGTRRLIKTVSRRSQEIVEMVALGRPILFLMSKSQQCYIQTGESTYSGTGRNRQTTNIVSEFDIIGHLFANLSPGRCLVVDSAGAEIELRGYDMLVDAWSKIKQYCRYECYFRTTPGRPILFVKGTTRPVGAVISKDKGQLLLLPSLEMALSHNKKAVRLEVSLALVELVESLVPRSNEQLPEWTYLYKLPGEGDLEKSIDTFDRQLEALQAQRLIVQSSLGRLTLLKQLIASQGAALEEQVAASFQELGATVTQGASGRTDLIVTFEDRVAVVEVKGLKKSAAEKNAAQLEKWVNEYHVQNEIAPKGILVVNAFYQTPFIARTESAFPHQMLSYAKSRKHCLITSGQMLALVLEGRSHPEKRPEILQRIFVPG